jgi:hypothetical protein
MSILPPIPIKHHLGAIFVHIPKTAGTSVHAVLGAAVLTASAIETRRRVIESFGPDSSALDRGLYPKHGKAAELRRLIGPNIWESAYKFTLVRNPWATMVSSYFWWLQKAPQYPFLAQRAELVKAMGGFRPFLFSELGRTMINELPGTMSDWFTEDGCDIVNFVGRVETIDFDIQTALSQMGATCPHAVPHLNRTERAHYRDYYDAETSAMVASRFVDIIDRFKYQF